MERHSLSALLRQYVHVQGTRQKACRVAARGFTVIEMIVVVFIITLLMALLLVAEASFNNSLFLTNTAYTIATSVRGAESLGLSSKGYSAQFTNAGYGIHFDSGALNAYTEFVDIANTKLTQTSTWCPTGTTGAPDAKPGDCVYNGGTEKVVQYNLTNGMKIADFCAYSSGQSLIGCATTNGNTISGLDVVFVRPNMDAVITATNASNAYQATMACVKLVSPTNNSAIRYVQMNILGEIAVTTSCP